MKIKGDYLVFPVNGGSFKNIKYQVLKDINDYKAGVNAIIVPALSSDFFLLFGSIKLIVCEQGSILAHLAILGREYSMPIYLSGNIIESIAKTGSLSIQDNILEI